MVLIFIHPLSNQPKQAYYSTSQHWACETPHYIISGKKQKTWEFTISREKVPFRKPKLLIRKTNVTLSLSPTYRAPLRTPTHPPATSNTQLNREFIELKDNRQRREIGFVKI